MGRRGGGEGEEVMLKYKIVLVRNILDAFSSNSKALKETIYNSNIWAISKVYFSLPSYKIGIIWKDQIKLTVDVIGSWKKST